MMRSVAVALLLLVATRAHAGGGSPLTALAPTYDAGTVQVGVPVQHVYELRNAGPSALAIDVKASCGCTTTDFDRTIPAGGTGHVSATLDTQNLRGPVAKTIHVTTGDAGAPPLVLTMRATVMGLLHVTPTDKPIVRRSVGDTRALELTVAAPDGTPFSIARVEDDPILRATVAPADRATTGAARRFRVTLTPKADLAVGTYTPTVTLVTTVAKAERFTLTPTIVVAGPLTVMPPQLHVRSCVARPSVHITKAGSSPFTVLAAEVSDRDFSAEAAPTEGGHAWDVTLRYTGKPDRHGPLDATLTIATDEPTQPKVVVAVTGEL
jgi:hypothetical protein